MKGCLTRNFLTAAVVRGFVAALALCAAHAMLYHSIAHAQPVKATAAFNAVPSEKFELAPKVFTGTLFTTHQQRARLDAARRRGGVLEDEVVTTTKPERSVINGFVKRSDGRDTVWVDDVMKRDPRSEVMEQLEPNVVGGSNGVSKRILTSTPELRSKVRKQTVVKATTKGRSQKNSRRSARPKLKLL